jgi:hypothetical protein
MAMNNVVRQGRDLARAAGSRREVAQEIGKHGFNAAIADLGKFTTAQFDEARKREGGLPCIIPAHNEGGPNSDLPATLLTLARTGEAYPVVVNNRSEDDTVAIAETMGAVVLDVPHGRKMAATKAGIQYVRHELQASAAHFTDADTLIPQRLPGSVSASLNDLDQGDGALLLGGSIKWHGPSMPADALLSSTGYVGTYRRMRDGREITAHGHNMGIKFDNQGVIEDSLMTLSDDMFVGEGKLADDYVMAQTISETDAAVSGTLNLDEYVLTRGDRLTSVRDVARLLLHQATYDELVAGSYHQEYNQY